MSEATLFDTGTAIQKEATISECGRFRYDLRRSWAIGDHVTFCMLNPSTADADLDDPTIRRCIGFARSWGFAGLYVVNLYALRATDPAELWKADDPIGPRNNLHIEVHAFCGPVVAAWGAHPRAAGRAAAVVEKLITKRRKLYAIRETKGGHPAHPLYLPAGLKPFVWKRGAR